MAKARLKSENQETVRIEARRAFYMPHLRAQPAHPLHQYAGFVRTRTKGTYECTHSRIPAFSFYSPLSIDSAFVRASHKSEVVNCCCTNTLLARVGAHALMRRTHKCLEGTTSARIYSEIWVSKRFA